jgi:hypothetical protein
MPLEENNLRTVHGLGDREPLCEVLFTPAAISLHIANTDPEEYWWKRAYACIGALVMPLEGLDEHLESTIDRFNYYKEMAALPPPASNPDPVQCTAGFTGFTQRPEFIVGE